jgi:hypothetical protein
MRYLIAIVLLVLIDAPWLIYQMGASQKMFTSIQGGSPLKMRPWAAIPVYLALAYILTQMKSLEHTGLCYPRYTLGRSLIFHRIHPFTQNQTLKSHAQ